MKWLGLALLLVFLWWGCWNRGFSTRGQRSWEDTRLEIKQRFPDVPSVTVNTLKDWLADGQDLLLIDSRSAEEYQISHIVGAQHLMTIDDVRSMINKDHQGKGIVCYCSVGWRSSKLASSLISEGFSQVWNLEDGIFAWANQGHGVVNQDGPQAVVHPFDQDWGRLLDEKYRYQIKN